jgi:hypothetical protein
MYMLTYTCVHMNIYISRASFLPLLSLLNLTGTNWGVAGDEERPKDRQIYMQLESGVLGTQMETHNSPIASYLY